MIMRLFFLVLSVWFTDAPLIAADTSSSHSKKIDKHHPLYMALKRNYTNEEIGRYRGKVDTFFADYQKRGKLSDGVGDALQYANFIENRTLKSALTETINKYSPLIKIKISTIVKSGEQDSVNYSWSMYFPKSSSLDEATGAILFTLRNLIGKGKIHESFNSLKSVARLSFFFLKNQGQDFSIFMNNNSESFAQVLEPWSNDDDSSSSSSHTHTASHIDDTIHRDDNTLLIAIKKEKEIERTIYFSSGFTQEIRRLDKVIVGQNWETTHDETRSNNPPSSSSSSPYPAVKTSSWGSNQWILQNYVEANFKLQKQAADSFLDADEDGKGTNPIYRHSDGYYYVDLGLNSVLQGGSVVLKLEELDTEYKFAFKEWASLSQYCALAPLLDILVKPQWNIPKLDEHLKESNFAFDVEHMFRSNQARLRNALPPMADQGYINWLREQLTIQVKTVVADKTHAEVSWYASTSNFIFCLPLYYQGKLVFAAAFEPVKTDSNMGLVMRTILLPAWAYNNARVLGAPKSLWMKQYASTFTDAEDSSQKAQQKAQKISYEAGEDSGGRIGRYQSNNQ